MGATGAFEGCRRATDGLLAEQEPGAEPIAMDGIAACFRKPR